MVARIGEVLADRSAEEENQDDGCGDPERPVEIGVALEDIEEVGARVQGGPAPRKNGRGVDIEILCVEGDGPEEALGAGAGGRRGHRRREA